MAACKHTNIDTTRIACTLAWDSRTHVWDCPRPKEKKKEKDRKAERERERERERDRERRCEDVKMRGCEGVRCENVWQTFTVKRTLRSDQGSVEEDPHIAAPVSRLLLSAWNPRSKTSHQRGFRYGIENRPPFWFQSPKDLSREASVSAVKFAFCHKPLLLRLGSRYDEGSPLLLPRLTLATVKHVKRQMAPRHSAEGREAGTRFHREAWGGECSKPCIALNFPLPWLWDSYSGQKSSKLKMASPNRACPRDYHDDFKAKINDGSVPIVEAERKTKSEKSWASLDRSRLTVLAVSSSWYPAESLSKADWTKWKLATRFKPDIQIWNIRSRPPGFCGSHSP